MYNIPFTKMHGLGNDYIYINCIDSDINAPHSLAIEMSDRHKGIGADGIILIKRSEIADFKMKMYNSDGSEGNMCGNACRCIARYVYEKGLIHETHISIETNAGIKNAHLILKGSQVSGVTIDMGTANFSPGKIPANSNSEIINFPIKTSSGIYHITALSVGNPHCVVFVNDLVDLDIKLIGPELENHSIFPNKSNIEFVSINQNGEIKARIWERGSGETMSCGTGACGIAAAIHKLQGGPNKQTIHMKGGDLEIYINPDNNHIYMTGDAEFVFEGLYQRKES